MIRDAIKRHSAIPNSQVNDAIFAGKNTSSSSLLIVGAHAKQFIRTAGSWDFIQEAA